MVHTEKMYAQSNVLIPELRQKFNGRLITPGDSGYEKASTPVFSGFDLHPAAIVRPANAEQIADVVRLARQSGLELAVRSGGHSAAAHSLSNGGVVLDLADMQDLQIDPVNKTAWAQSGLTAGKYTHAVHTHGLATGFGDTATVGLGGLTLGGGLGYLSRKFGLTIDQLLAAEMVTAEGELIYTDAQSHPDLFWALRGGGGNFGVVTRFKFQLHPIDQVYGGMLILPASADVIAGLVEAADAAPDELSLIANIMKAPPMPFLPAEVHGKLIVMALMVYCGDLSQAEAAVAPFRKLAAPMADMVRPVPYPGMFPSEENDFRPFAVMTNLFTNSINRTQAQGMLDQIQSSTATMAAVQLRVLGGAVSRVPEDATAFAHRKQHLLAHFISMFTNPEEQAVHQEWVNSTSGLLAQKNPGRYANFLSTADAAAVRQCYPGATWERLTMVKARYDPDNFFHLNQNIPPLKH